MSKSFGSAKDFADHATSLAHKHEARIQKHLELQSMWQQPITSTETGRTIYVNNEPWTATRLIVSLLTAGTVRFKAFMPPGDTDTKERKAQLAKVENLLSCHYTQTDFRRWRSGMGRYKLRSDLAYWMAVPGWHAGINLVEDLKGWDGRAWPIFSDIWDPLDTFNDVDNGTGIVHHSRMSRSKIERVFGKKRIGGKIKGYDFSPDPQDGQDDPVYVVSEWWDDETSMVAVFEGEKFWVLKPQTEHGLGHNPAWCQPVGAVPFRSTAWERGTGTLAQVNPDSYEWVAHLGQSPMLGYQGIHRIISETAEMIGTVLENWADPKVLAQTRDGRFVDIDLRRKDGAPNFVAAGEVISVLAPPTFPGDQRAWMEFLLSEQEKSSFSRVLYGVINGSLQAAQMQLVAKTANMVVNPLIDEMDMVFETGGDSILRQLNGPGDSKRKAQYTEPIAVRSLSAKGSRVVDYINLADLPDRVDITAQLKGAGIQADKLQTLQTVTAALQVPNPALSHATILDDILEQDDPDGEMARIREEKIVNSPEAMAAAAPYLTLTNMVADLRRKKNSPMAQKQAQVLEVVAEGALIDLRNKIQKIMMEAAGVGEQAAPAAPTGAPVAVDPATGQPAPEGVNAAVAAPGQQDGVAPVGAPVAGVAQPPSGPAMDRGAAMAAAQLAQGG